jgi:hypothetical protein
VIYQLLAGLVVILHLLFVLFVVLGGFLVLRWRWLAWIHLPAALWGIGIEWLGGVCPLTPLEIYFRRLGGEAGYTGGFVEHYILPVLYPDGLTPEIEIGLGVLVLVVNAVAYAVLIRRRRRRRPPCRAPS